jgi:hypothetical protein
MAVMLDGTENRDFLGPVEQVSKVLEESMDYVVGFIGGFDGYTADWISVSSSKHENSKRGYVDGLALRQELNIDSKH